MGFEIELLNQRLDVPEAKVWLAISMYWAVASQGPYAAAFASRNRDVTDIRNIQKWHGDYDGVELEIEFPKDGDKLIWFGVTHVGQSPLSRHEHILGFVEVSRASLSSDTPIDVRVVCAWRPVFLLFKGMADTILSEFTRQPTDLAFDELLAFKALVERQTYRDIYVKEKPQENIARGFLQTFLYRRSYREVPVRGGQSDVLVFDKQGRFLYETKIWRGSSYFQQGLREIEEYIIGEEDDDQLAGIFYVLFDPTKSNAAHASLGSDISTTIVHKRTVQIVIININPPMPSTKQ